MSNSEIEGLAVISGIAPSLTGLEKYPTSPDTPEEQISTRHSQWHRLRGVIGEAAIGLAILAPATTVGVATGLEVATSSSTVNIAPGISTEVEPALSPDLTITYGPTIVIPDINKDIAGLTTSARIRITNLDTHNHSAGQAVSAILDGSLGPIQSKISDAIIQRGRQGLAIGTSLFGLLSFGGFLAKRRLRSNKEGGNEPSSTPKINGLGDNPPEIDKRADPDTKQPNKSQPPTYRPWRKAAALIVLGAITLGGSYKINQEYDALRTPLAESTSMLFPNGPTNPATNLVDEYAPILKGASISGDVGYYAAKSISKILDEMEEVDNKWQNQADYFVNTALPEFRANGGMDWQNNPDITAFVQISDIHDNRPFLKYFLPKVLSALNIGLVVNTGDEMNYSGTLFLDDGAYQRFIDALPVSTQAVIVSGNHDKKSLQAAGQLTAETRDGKRYHPLIPLDSKNNYSVTIDGLTFVGSPDSNRTTAAGTVPTSPKDQIANDINDGNKIVKRSCKIYQETGVKPIAIAHEPAAIYPAVISGCDTLALNGHTHVTYSIQTYASDNGSITYQQTLGTASGDGPNNIASIYNNATIEGSISIWLCDKSTGQPTGSIMISYSPNGLPSIKPIELPSADEAISATDDPQIMAAVSPQG
ncbi:MAG: metallophosphoesterase [Candidatus Saccharimonadales bacterium]